MEKKLKEENRMKENNKVGKPDEWELGVVNFIPKIIKNLASVYDDEYILEVIDDNLEVNEEWTDRYIEIMDNAHADYMRAQANEWALAFNTFAVMPVIRGGELKFDMFAPHMCKVDIDPDDYLKMRSFAIAYRDSNGEVYYDVWEKEIKYKARYDGTKIMESIEENPYGKIPVVICRLRDKGSFWGEGMRDAVEMNTEVNVQLSGLLTHGLYQGGSQLFGVNIGDNAVVAMGPNKVLSVKSTNAEFSPDLRYITPDPKVKEISDLIKFLTQTIFVNYGLPANTYSYEGADEQSGIAKIIDNAELAKNRRDQIGAFREFERKLFTVVQKVWNYAVENKELIDEKIIEGYSVRVNFAEPQVYTDEATRLELNKAKVDMGLKSIYQLIREEEGDVALSDEECQEKLEKNLELKRQIGDKYGIFETVKTEGGLLE